MSPPGNEMKVIGKIQLLGDEGGTLANVKGVGSIYSDDWEGI